MQLHLYVTAPQGEYRLCDAAGLQWFSHYGADGGGYGYLTWRMARRVGYDYREIGYAYPVELRKGPFRTLFAGQITRLTERSAPDGDEIEVWALGWVHVAQADIHNHVYADTRYTEWRSAETPVDLFHPEWFDWDIQDRIRIGPRAGTYPVSTDGAYSYLRYTFNFGETARRFVADYALALSPGGELRVEVLADGAVLWSAAGPAGTFDPESGEPTSFVRLDLTTTGSPTTFEVRLYIVGDQAEIAGVWYAQFENVVVYSEASGYVDAQAIATDMVTTLAAHGLSAATTRLAATGLDLTPAAFDTDMTVTEVLTWACRLGNAAGQPLAWGVTFDATRRLFLESPPLDLVKYVVKAGDGNLERAGDWSESAQVVYGVYSGDDGQTRRTGNYVAAGAVEKMGGYYMRRALSLGNIPTAALADVYLRAYLNENAYPRVAGTYSVGEVFTPDGRRVPFDEVQPGGLVQIREFRAVEAEAGSADFRDRTTTFILAGVNVDNVQRRVELLPNEDNDQYRRQMALLERLLGG